MSIITVTQPSDGTTIDAADVNDQVNTILQDYNGNIDSDNLATSAVIAAKIASNSVETAKIKDANVTAGKLATSAIFLDHVAVTTSQTGITTETDLTNLTSTVTVPAGGRSLEITVYLPAISTTVSGDPVIFSLVKGSDVVQKAYFTVTGAYATGPINIHLLEEAVAAGSYTYKVTAARAAGTASFGVICDVGYPATMDIKLI